MKRIALAALMLAAPVLTAAQSVPSAPPATKQVMREFVHNSSVADWYLSGGWTWTDGVLTHWPGATSAVQQVAMPTLTVGKTYRVSVGFSGRTKGSVSVSLGKGVISGVGGSGGVSLVPVVKDETSLLTFTPTSDYDGSIGGISVVELGNELIDETAWALPDGWSQQGDVFKHVPAMASSLERVVDLAPGHMYQLTFSAVGAAPGSAPGGNGTVTLGGKKTGWFSLQGGWNFKFDIEAGTDNRLAFTPESGVQGEPVFDGIVSHVSVREITTDPAPAPVAQVSTSAR